MKLRVTASNVLVNDTIDGSTVTEVERCPDATYVRITVAKLSGSTLRWAQRCGSLVTVLRPSA